MARVSRTKEERIADIDSQIAAYQKRIKECYAKIEALEEKKERINNPTPRHRKNSMGNFVQKIKASGLTVEEMAEKLGLDLE